MINYAGVSSDDVNVIVETYPERPIPERRYTVTPGVGRSGDYVENEGDGPTYNDVERRYAVYLTNRGGAADYQDNARAAADWLLRPSGYQRLYDSYDPEAFCYARFVGPVTFTNSYNELGRGEIVFSCNPWRYLFAGDAAQAVASGDTLTNPTQFDARPLIVVNGSGAGQIEIGSYTVSISDIDDGMIIDSELMDCYRAGANRNSLVTLSPQFEYPALVPGANTITFNGGITGLTITPRWRTL